MFLVCLVLNEVFLIVCCNTPNKPKKAICINNLPSLSLFVYSALYNGK